MFKKLVIASAVFAASSGVALAGHVYRGDYKCEAPCAAPCATPCCQPFCAAPYVGFSLYPRTVIAGSGHGGAAAYKGFGGNLFAGYGAMMSCNFYLAGELFVGDTWKLKDYRTRWNWASTDGTRRGHAHGGSVKTTWDVGLSVLPGFLVTDCILTYLRLGATDTRFNSNSSGHRNNNNNTKWGWHVGVGAQSTICQNWDLRGEYIYTQYGRLNGNRHRRTVDGVTRSWDHNTGHPQSDQFNLGIVYKFL